MDSLIDPTTGDYAGQRIDTLANAVYLRLMTPLGSWWADPTLGSRLHELQREKDLTRVCMFAKQYSEDALRSLLDSARARRIEVSATRTQPGWCDLHIEVEDASGRLRTFQHPVAVA